MAKNNFSFNNRYNIEDLTGDKTITEQDCGKVFTNRVAGSATITLPTASMIFRGFNFKAITHNTNDIIVEGASGTVIIRNDTQAGLTATGSPGLEIFAFCDGQNWFVYGKTDGGGVGYVDVV